VRILLMLCLLTLPLGAESSQFTGWVYFDEETDSPQTLIIRTVGELKAFQARLPDRVPSKKHPAPENKDPLRSASPVDLEKHILIVALRSGTISAHPVHLATSKGETGVTVTFSTPDPPAEARPYGWGVYRAILIPRTKKTITIEFAPTTEPNKL
jgi:hypothetical protein